MLFLAGKYVQPAKLNAITRQITNEEIDEPDYAFSSDDEVNNWNTTENRDVMNSTLNELELTPFKFMLYLDIRKLLMENEHWLKLTMRCQKGWQKY